MSVGHVARSLEHAGISTVTVGIRAFRGQLEAMTLPRVLVTPHPMGRTLGAPCADEGQCKTILRALDLLEEADKPGTIMELAGRYRPTGCPSRRGAGEAIPLSKENGEPVDGQ